MNQSASFCEQCGAQLAPDQRFCERCGAPTAATARTAAADGHSRTAERAAEADIAGKSPVTEAPAKKVAGGRTEGAIRPRRWILITVAAIVLIGAAVVILSIWSDTRSGPFDGPPSLEERFSEPSGRWELWEDGNASARIEAGVLRARVLPGQFRGATLVGTEFSNFALRVEVTLESGKGAFGIVARRQDDSNFYQFVVSSDGQALISETQDGNWVSASEWTELPAFRMGNTTNVLEIICQGGGLAFYVNGAVAAAIVADSFERGGIGLFVTAFKGSDASEMTVAFDNLQIWELR